MKTDALSGKYRIVAEINMIPFIDISLVLLIIFMVMTPFLIRAQIKVNLPEAGKTETKTENEEALTVQVDKNGGIFVDGEPVASDNLLATLRRKLHNPQTQPLYVEADQDVSFRNVVVVLDAGNQSGVSKMGICVRPEKKDADAPRRR